MIVMFLSWLSLFWSESLRYKGSVKLVPKFVLLRMLSAFFEGPKIAALLFVYDCLPCSFGNLVSRTARPTVARSELVFFDESHDSAVPPPCRLLLPD